MFGSAHRARLERRLSELETQLTALHKRLVDIEGNEFGLTELRRQARNAVRSLERAAANAQEAAGPTNGKGRGVEPGPQPINPPGPRRNY